ncbi:MAG: stage III sporulation protein AC [Firmicutes bacterium]|nr:stage III sporulation protein AC [Bacillota bacterium]
MVNVDIILKIASVGLLTAVVCQILKKADKDEIATLAALAGLIVALIMVINMVTQLFDLVKTSFGLFNVVRDTNLLDRIWKLLK